MCHLRTQPRQRREEAVNLDINGVIAPLSACQPMVVRVAVERSLYLQSCCPRLAQKVGQASTENNTIERLIACHPLASSNPRLHRVPLGRQRGQPRLHGRPRGPLFSRSPAGLLSSPHLQSLTIPENNHGALHTAEHVRNLGTHSLLGITVFCNRLCQKGLP